MCSQREHIRADLVGNVTVGGDPVRTVEDFLNLTRLQKMPGHVIADDLVRDAVLLTFPGSKPCTLQTWTRLIHKDVDTLPLFMRGADDTQSRTPIHGGEGTRVAVMDY